MRNERIRINEWIRAKELRVIGPDGENIGVITREEDLQKAREADLDLIEISPTANPPIAKIADYGKYQYEQNKKQKETKAKSHSVEIKSVQVKVGTGEHDLALKAKKASEWLKDGHRIRVELFLKGRSKYMDQKFLRERLDRILNLITTDFKIAEEAKRSPKGLSMMIEKK